MSTMVIAKALAVDNVFSWAESEPEIKDKTQ